MATTLLLLLLLLLSLSHPSHCTPSPSSSPFTAKAALLRYWNRKIPNNLPQPSFFTSKLSPLSPLDLAAFSSLSPTELSSKLPSFCSSARLLCSPPLKSSLSSHNSPSNFTSYSNSNFTNYATHGAGFNNSFSSYSPSENVPFDTFRRYSRDAVGDADSFISYSADGNVVTTNFTSYSASTSGGSGDFSLYHPNSNIPDLTFTSYDSSATGSQRDFTSYTQSANVGNATFANYAKSSNGVPTTFTSYSDTTNIIVSKFSAYGEAANGALDNFTSYGKNSNVPDIEFKSYGDGGTGPVDNFALYRNTSGDGDDSFVSYGKKANGEKAGFENYGYIPPSTGGFGYGTGTNKGKDSFKGYGEGSFDDVFNFTNYLGHFNEFAGYANDKPNENVFSFKSYVNATNVPNAADNSQLAELMEKMKDSKPRASMWVDPGKFFRERELMKGTVMPMPDIRDKMPPRSFLPRAIAAKIPFSATEIKEMFKIHADTAMGKAIDGAIGDCERAPSRGEKKRCATSAEDMIDFAVSVLGSNVVVRSTENTNGSKGDIMIGDVKGINGGKITESVSCHQSLFPYLAYYCHSVPKVRVYEADILAVDTKQQINHGVAICHLDTSDWSAGHGAFVALGSAPGQIEVCHWIFEGDMTWIVAD